MMMRRRAGRRPWWAAEEEETTPFENLEENMRRQMRWPRGWSDRTQTGEWTPVVDMFDQQERLVVRAELPGVPQEQIDITLENGILTIRGERTPDEELSGDEWLCCERAMGKFYRAIQLPTEIDAARVEATYKDGVLTIFLPKKPETQPKKVNVSLG